MTGSPLVSGNLKANGISLREANFWRSSWYVLRRNPLTLVGFAIILLVFVLAVGAQVISPYPQELMDLKTRLEGPNLAHLLGTDQFGRDVLSRIFYGAQVSLAVGLGSTILSMLAGVTMGAFAAYYGKWVDEILMRSMDILLAFPYIVLAIALAAVVGPSFENLVGITAVLRVPQFARVARGAVLGARSMDYVEAARTVGQRDLVILWRHIMPNAITPIVVLATLTIATAINTEAALSFLGMGIQPPQSSWGTMLSDGRRFMGEAPWIATFPGLFISLTILGYNLLGDGLRDILDPHTRRGSG